MARGVRGGMSMLKTKIDMRSLLVSRSTTDICDTLASSRRIVLHNVKPENVTLGLRRHSDLLHILILDLKGSMPILQTVNILHCEKIEEHRNIPVLTCGSSEVSLL